MPYVQSRFKWSRWSRSFLVHSPQDFLFLSSLYSNYIHAPTDKHPVNNTLTFQMPKSSRLTSINKYAILSDHWGMIADINSLFVIRHLQLIISSLLDSFMSLSVRTTLFLFLYIFIIERLLQTTGILLSLATAFSHILYLKLSMPVSYRLAYE